MCKTPTVFERMRDLVRSDPRFINLVNKSLLACSTLPQHQSTLILADNLCGLFGFSAEVHAGVIVLYNPNSRGKAPACITISPEYGQPPSPSAAMLVRTARVLIQVFEGDADDRDVAEPSARPTNWTETKGRVLLH